MEQLSLNKEQFDALKEIGNVGAGNAATALNQLLTKKVTIDIPHVSLLSMDATADYSFLKNRDEVTAAVSMKILGSLKGEMLVLFSQKSAAVLADILMEREIGSSRIFNILEVSSIAEASHILCSSYLAAVGEFIQIYQLIPLISHITIDTMKVIADILIKGVAGSETKYILPIENHLVIEGVEMQAYVVFILEYESVMKMLSMVGL